MAVCRDRARRRVPVHRTGHPRLAGALVLGALLAPHSAAPEASAPDGPPLALTVEPPTFGAVDVGDSAQVHVVARNVTSATVSIEDVRLATDSGAFVVVADTCEHALLDPDETCDVTVAFQPATEGDDSAMVQMDTSAGSAETALGGRGIGTVVTVPVPPTSVGPTVARHAHRRTDRRTNRRTHRRTDRRHTHHRTDRGDTARRRVGRGTARRLRGAGTASDDQLRHGAIDDRRRDPAVRRDRDDPGGGTRRHQTTVAPDVTVVAVALRCEVQAQLRGADFRVDPAEFQPRSFLDQPSVEWSWDVVPLKAGTSVLSLEIRSVAVIDGRRIEGAGTQLYQSTVTITTKDQGFGADVKRWTSSVVDFPLVRGFGSLLVIFGALAAALAGGAQAPVAVEAWRLVGECDGAEARTVTNRRGRLGRSPRVSRRGRAPLR